MDRGSEGYYIALVKMMPYLIAGFFISLPLNWILVSVGSANSAFRFYGWPFFAGETIGGVFLVNYIGFFGNVLVWTVILALVTYMLVKIFGPKDQ